MRSYGNIFLSSNRKKARTSKWTKTIVILIIGLLTWILTLISRNNPKLVEKVYSSSLYPYIARAIGWISGIFPISIAEIFIIGLTLLGIISIVFILVRPRIFINNYRNIFHYSIRFLGLIYVLFYFLWGFNYYREDYMNISKMSKEAGTMEELKELTSEVINKLNILRQGLAEDENGVFTMEESFGDLNLLAQKGFKDFKVGSLSLDGNYGRAKPVLLSKVMSYTGIAGIYFPFTTEANVNVDIPFHDLPSTICHEIAHQRGFAKEDEANFIAYKTSVNNPDNRFKYSGYYLAMNALMNDIYKRDKEAYLSLYSTISDPVKRDMDYSRDYWKSKEGRLEKAVNNMNDNYLKANNQEAGVGSYNRVVELLLAEFKDRKK